jgi:hypothetical protein
LVILGLAPQALCFRPLRGLVCLYEFVILGLAPLRGLDSLYEFVILGLAPLRGLASLYEEIAIFGGLRPKLYASARFAGSRLDSINATNRWK